MTFKYVMAVGVMMASSAQALQTYPLIDQQKTKATISRTHLTRIAVIEDRIEQIFGAESLFDIQSDEQRGQIFLKPLNPHESKPFSMTIVTENGLTHDLVLIPQDVEAQSIVFKPQVEVTATNKPEPTYESVIIDLMKAMVEGKNLKGYSQFKLTNRDRRNPNLEQLKLTPQLLYRGRDEVGRVYQIENTSDSPLSLVETHFKRPGDLALSFGTRKLEPATSTTLYVISKEGEGS